MSLLNRLHMIYLDETTDGDPGGGGDLATPAQDAPSAEEMAAAPVDDGSADLDFDGISAILSSPDPFAEPVGEVTLAETDGADGAQPEGGTEAEPGTTETPTPTEKPKAEEPAAPQATPEMALLRSQLETQQQLIAELQKGTTATPGKGEAGANETPAGPEVPAYNFSIPDGLMNLMDSEDPAERRQGVAAMAQGVASTVHQQMLSQVQEMFTTVVPQTVLGVIQQQNTSRAIFEDFYGTHEELNKPELKELVVQVAQKAWKDSKAQQWSPELRDLIAAKVNSILNQRVPATPPAKPTTPADPGAGRQSRANNAAGVNNLADDIGALLF